MKPKPLQQTKAQQLAVSLCDYILGHPDERFWQALRNWAGESFIYVLRHDDKDGEYVEDTFYFKGKTK